MAASMAASGSGAGALDSGLVSATTFVASSRAGRSVATVHPKPRVNHARWVDSVKRTWEVLDPPASLT